MDGVVFAPDLTKPDILVLRNLVADIQAASAGQQSAGPRRQHVYPPAGNGSAQAAAKDVASQVGMARLRFRHPFHPFPTLSWPSHYA
jgi:hypothetical protein